MRKATVEVTMTVTSVYEIDLDSVAYEGIGSIQEALDADLDNADNDPSLFLENNLENVKVRGGIK